MNILIYITVFLLILNQTVISAGAGAYFFLILILCVFFIQNRLKIKFDLSIIFILLICLCSIFVNDIPTVFNVYYKFFGFIVLLLIASNLIYNSNLLDLRSKIIVSFYKISIVIMLISFTGVILNFIPKYNENEAAGGFSSFFNNSVFFGGYVAIILLLVVGKWFQKKQKKYIVLITMLVYLLLISGARSAMLALGISIFYFVLRQFGIMVFLRKYWFTSLLIVLIFIYLISTDFFIVITNKMEASSNLGYNSREILWGHRISEFLQNPFFGVGFNSVDLSISKYEFKSNTGAIEPGSSWMFIVSSLGVFGVMSFLVLLYGVIKNMVKQGGINKYILDSLFVFFIVHFLFEGYIFAVGNILVYIFYISCCFIVNKKELCY